MATRKKLCEHGRMAGKCHLCADATAASKPSTEPHGISSRYLYVKVTTKKKQVHYEEIRVWDYQRKLTSLQMEHAETGSRVEEVTQADFRNWKWRK